MEQPLRGERKRGLMRGKGMLVLLGIVGVFVAAVCGVRAKAMARNRIAFEERYG